MERIQHITRTLGDDRAVRGDRRAARRAERRFHEAHGGLGERALLKVASILG